MAVRKQKNQSSCLWLKLEKSLYPWNDNIATITYFLTIQFSIQEYSHPYPSSTCSPSTVPSSSMYRTLCSYSHHTSSPPPLQHFQIIKTIIPPQTALPQSPGQNSSAFNRVSLYTQRSPPQYKDSNFLGSTIVKISSALHIHCVSFSHSLIIYFHLWPTSQLCTFSNSIPC